MKHINTDMVMGSNGPMPTFNKETCEYLTEVINEVASITVKGQSLTFSTPVGKVSFIIE